MRKIISSGSTVLIFKNNKEYIKGSIISSAISKDLALYGTPVDIQVYKVIGEDNKTYICPYGNPFLGDNYIKTIDDQIDYYKTIKDDTIGPNNNLRKLQKLYELKFNSYTNNSKIPLNAYDFLCIFIAINIWQNKYYFNIDTLESFVDICKNESKYENIFKIIDNDKIDEEVYELYEESIVNSSDFINFNIMKDFVSNDLIKSGIDISIIMEFVNDYNSYVNTLNNEISLNR